MRFVVLLDCNHADLITIASDEFGDNLIFESREEADEWCCRNAGGDTFVKFLEVE